MKKKMWRKGFIPEEYDSGLFEGNGKYFSLKGLNDTLLKIKLKKNACLSLNPYRHSQDQKAGSHSQNDNQERRTKKLEDLFQRDTSLKDKPMAVKEHDLPSAGSAGEPCVVPESKANPQKDLKWYLNPAFHEPPIVKESPMQEQQFKVIEKEFGRQISDRCPKVRVHKVSSTVVFEGPDDEVQSGVAILDKLVEQVKKRTVNLSTALLTFINSSSAILRFASLFEQTLKHTVSVEGGSQLVLSSLSSEALDEAEATLRRDTSLITVQLLNVAGPVLHRVKETMAEATRRENMQELRVNTNFIPTPKRCSATKVRLVGHTENVKKLKEILHQSVMSQGDTQEVLNLPDDFVNSFDDFFKLVSPRQTAVTVQACPAPNPHIVLTGPPSAVQEALEHAKATLATRTTDTLLINGPGAHWHFQTEGQLSLRLIQRSCQVFIKETLILSEGQQGTNSNKPKVGVKLGLLEDEKADILVAPMVKCQLQSTNIGKSLLRKAGNILQLLFKKVAAASTLNPGDVLQVDAPASLGCSKLFFIECLPWDGVSGNSVQALEKGLLKCLHLCKEQRLHTVALPVIGPGPLLQFNMGDAIEVLTNKVRQFASSTTSKFPSNIHIVIKPDNPNSKECYNKVCECLRAAINSQSQSIFKSLTTDLDSVVMTFGSKVKLHMIFGDITNERTEAVVNTTDFKNFNNDGVCKDILAIAGPEVASELRAMSEYAECGDVYQSQTGSYPCSVLLHVCGENDADLIEKILVYIVNLCENLKVTSVAIPALRTGAAKMDASAVARAILLGVKAATSFISLDFLREVRLVLFRIDVFLAFKQEAMKMFPSALNNTGPVPELHHVQQQPHFSTSEGIHQLVATSAGQKSSFLILGRSRKDVDDAKTRLSRLYEAQCSTVTFRMEEVANLSSDEMKELKLLMESQHLCMEEKQDCKVKVVIVTGSKDGVNQVSCLVTTSTNRELNRELKVREENDLCNSVTWCILLPNGDWKKVPKRANYLLEKKEVSEGILDGQGMTWNIDLVNMEATSGISGQRAKLKRLVNLPDFKLPLCWDNMTTGEKLFTLPPHCQEYETVEKAFSQTAVQTVIKIERVQNVYLRRAYEVQKKRIAEKNRLEGGAGEKLLYHGTTHSNAKQIVKEGFNRRFAGKNATSLGHGTYFAVEAKYSAKRTYSKPEVDGTKFMIVARVLTGTYTLGHKDMTLPPYRNSGQSQDRFDSVVDVLSDPSMYVVFHDHQAYPEYLITFK